MPWYGYLTAGLVVWITLSVLIALAMVHNMGRAYQNGFEDGQQDIASRMSTGNGTKRPPKVPGNRP